MAKNFDVTIESSLPVVQQNGLNTEKNTNLGGTLAVVGVTTFTATPVFSSGITATTVVKSAAVGATVVLTAAQSGGVFINASTSGSPSWTLPAATTAGLEYTFICGNTTAGFTVTGAQVIHFKTSATGTALTSTTTLTNTQATAVVGDAISLVSDGSVWWMTSQTGVFAAS